MKIRTLLPLFITASTFYSCSVSQYIPPTVSAPLFKEPNEAVLQGFIGLNHAEVQAAYSFKGNFAMMTDIWIGDDKRFSAELAPGFYFKGKNNFCIEGFAGVGFASASTVDESTRNSVLSGIKYTVKYETTAPYQFIFIQPGLGYRSRHWEIAVAPRISYVNYSDFYYSKFEKDNNYQRNYKLIEKVDKGQMAGWTLQPTLMVRACLKKVKVFVSTSINFISFNNGLILATRAFVPFGHPFLLSVGIHLRLGSKGE